MGRPSISSSDLSRGESSRSCGARWPLWLEVGLVAALATVLALRAGGVARAHLRPVAAHLALAAAMLPAFQASLRIERRYARRLAVNGVPMGVRFAKPLWMELSSSGCRARASAS
jgi:hypothetical protein